MNTIKMKVNTMPMRSFQCFCKIKTKIINYFSFLNYYCYFYYYYYYYNNNNNYYCYHHCPG
jgi:hypothetical protein